MQLEAKNLGFRYDRRQDWCIKEVHLSISSGEMVGLRGPSGAGKSTLARLLAGYLQPVEGEVLLDGTPLSLNKGYAPVQLVLQHPELAINPRWRMGKVLQEAGQHDTVLLHSLGIDEAWLARRPGELSGGEMQRFCVARALGAGTKFLIADEMTTMLDAVTQAQIWNVVRDMAAERELGILVISHEEGLLSQLCSRIIEWK